MKISMERASQMVKVFLAKEHSKSIYITKAEREALKRLGYDPDKCRLIERVDGGSVFIYAPKIYGPIIISEMEERSGG